MQNYKKERRNTRTLNNQRPQQGACTQVSGLDKTDRTNGKGMLLFYLSIHNFTFVENPPLPAPLVAVVCPVVHYPPDSGLLQEPKEPVLLFRVAKQLPASGPPKWSARLASYNPGVAAVDENVAPGHLGPFPSGSTNNHRWILFKKTTDRQ